MCVACDSCTVGNRSFVDLESVAFLSTLFFLFPKLLNFMLNFVFTIQGTGHITSFGKSLFLSLFFFGL